jgi:hypothetical protein
MAGCGTGGSQGVAKEIAARQALEALVSGRF